MAASPGSNRHYTSAAKPVVRHRSAVKPFTSKFTTLSKSSSLPPLSFLATGAHDPASFLALFTSGVSLITATGVLDHLPALRIIVTSSIGLDHIDLPECRRWGITLANAGEIFQDNIADTAVALTIDVFVRKGVWAFHVEYPFGSKVSGKRVGIIGLGSIGSRVARRMEAFGRPLSYNSRSKKPLVPYAFYSGGVHELASNIDILDICCALNKETHHPINKSVMLALGKDGVIINVGRGAILNEKELVKCLVRGDIGGTGLDVFENEPNVTKEFFSLDNVVLSPHVAVFTEESFRYLAGLMVGNLEAFFANKPLLSAVNLH